MRLEVIEQTLRRLEALIAEDRFEELETDTLELKPVPSTGHDWHRIHETACAFLNTRGGIILLGIKEEGQGAARRYRFTGWQPHAEPNLRELPRKFTDFDGKELRHPEAFPSPLIEDFLDGKVAAVLVGELPSDLKYAFYREAAYKRVLTGDVRVSQWEHDAQREFREATAQARELQPVPGVGLDGLDLDKLNRYIQELNRLELIETVKADHPSALSFLERKCFIKNGVATTLGVLVCGKHPGDSLEFRCHVHGYVDMPQDVAEVARDKQDFVDNILGLMERSLAFVLRNIHVGITVERGGTSQPQYPEVVLRETINNALAHRDLSINRQSIIAIKPGREVEIQNPGKFRSQLLIEDVKGDIPIRRILPEAKPRNPKLADVLRVYRKWEGRGIGMATLVNLALRNEIDLPCYTFKSEEVSLHLRPGRLLDEHLERLFQSYDRYIGEKLHGAELTGTQKAVLGYLIKSERANNAAQYTILLTPDNNHFHELSGLEAAGLISLHSISTPSHPVYVADRVLMRENHFPELQAIFKTGFDHLDNLSRQALSVVYRYQNFSRKHAVSAKSVAFDLWAAEGKADDIKAFDAFYRKIRDRIARLKKLRFIRPTSKSTFYELNDLWYQTSSS